MLNIFKEVMAVSGALSVLCTSLALFFPKGSKIGYALAKVGTDLKGHTQPTDDVKEAA